MKLNLDFYTSIVLLGESNSDYQKKKKSESNSIQTFKITSSN